MYTGSNKLTLGFPPTRKPTQYAPACAIPPHKLRWHIFPRAAVYFASQRATAQVAVAEVKRKVTKRR